jgi:glycerophosphoryl diester phosphodiesterase
MHDETLDRTTNGTGKVVEMSLAQIRKYVVDYYSGVAAQPIPTLEDYFLSIRNNPNQKLVIEMKHPHDARLATAMTSLIQKYDIMDQVVIISFLESNLIHTRNIMPGIPAGRLSWLTLDETNPVYSAYEAIENVQGGNFVCNPGYSGWGEAAIRELAYRGVTLWPWTLNKQAEFDKLMIDGVAGITTDYPQWSRDYIESIHWNSASRVISSTYHDVLTDITNSCEVVVIEDTLGISCSAGNITVPQTKEGGKASFYYRYKRTNASGTSYYTVTEIRTIVIPGEASFALKAGSSLSLQNGQLLGVSDAHTVADIKAQFQYAVGVLDRNGNTLSDSDSVTTGSIVYLLANDAHRATIVMKGDVNGDGVADKADYQLLRRYLLKTADLSGIYLQAADCDDDGIVTITDYLRIKAHSLGTFDLYA